MSVEADPSIKSPPLFEGLSVPFEKLSADDFEKCVFGCFLAIQSHQELRVDGQPAGSGDGGFDVYGVAENSQRKLCIQCKRQKASLGLPLLAKELAKVALTTFLEKSDVGVHFFICTGGGDPRAAPSAPGDKPYRGRQGRPVGHQWGRGRGAKKPARTSHQGGRRSDNNRQLIRTGTR